MLTLEDAITMEINAPKAHQRIIAKLTTRLMNLYEQGQIALEPLPETMLDESQTSPTPDVSLYDAQNAQTPVIIEIAHSDGARNDFKKIRRLIDESDYGIEEGFVYDYKKNAWRKCKKTVGEVLDKPSFCETLNLDFATLLER